MSLYISETTMKRYIIILGLLSSSICFANPDSFDKYTPLCQNNSEQYKPSEYLGIRAIQPFDINSFSPSIDLNGLKAFIHTTNANPDIANHFVLPYSKYIDIAAKACLKRTNPKWNKHQLDAYFKDYRTLEYYVWKKDSVQIHRSLEEFIRDSISKRKQFVQDSISKRNLFLKDSLAARERFVVDSVYRAKYKKDNGYDRVEWSAPHGVPIKCYRNGLIIYGKEVDSEGRTTKEWNNGKLIHDYTYGKDGEYNYQEDQILKPKKRVLYRSKIDDYTYILWYDGSGRVIKEQGADGSFIKYSYFQNGEERSSIHYDSNGDVYYSYVTEYYSDGSGRHRSIVIHYDVGIFRNYPTKEITDFYSDGTWFESREYRSYDKGKSFTIYKYSINKGVCTIDTIYDRNGNKERIETNYY